jgi:hypothetical protein
MQSDLSSSLEDIEGVYRQFSLTFLGGVPLLLNDGGAFLSFICVLSGTESLAGFRYPDVKANGSRFKAFVTAYFPPEYRPLADNLWRLRNCLVHAFSPGPFLLCHHQSDRHFVDAPHGGNVLKTLNAENFYAALVHASAGYFAEVRVSADLQQNFRKRLADENGGAPMIVVIK